jgi:hypothetical protein
MIDISLGDDVLLNDELDIFLQEIDILFNTKLTSILGDYSWGTDFQQFLWRSIPNAEEVYNYAKNKIANLPLANKFTVEVGCDYIDDDDNYDGVYYLQIAVTDNRKNIRKRRDFVFHNYNE